MTNKEYRINSVLSTLGSLIIANPQGTASGNLEKIQLGNTVFNVGDPSGDNITLNGTPIEEEVQPQVSPLRNMMGLRSAPEPVSIETKYNLTSVKIGDDLWIIGQDEQTASELSELQTKYNTLQANYNALAYQIELGKVNFYGVDSQNEVHIIIGDGGTNEYKYNLNYEYLD